MSPSSDRTGSFFTAAAALQGVNGHAGTLALLALPLLLTGP